MLVALLLRVSDAARRPAPAPVTPDVARQALESAQTQVVRRPKVASGDSPAGAS
jgi:hypothetical protein